MQQIQITEDILEELLYFTDTSVEDVAMNEEILKKPSMALLLKRSSDNLPSAIDDVVAQMVYGNMRSAPGDNNCPYQQLVLTVEEKEFPGIWVPPNSLSKAMGLKWLFPSVSGPHKFPEEKPIPPHVAVGYDAFKYKDVMELMQQYPGQVISYGFFTSDIPGEAQLIAKTVDKFENRTISTTYEEKIIIQLAKVHSDCFLAFSELGPSYMSASTVEGEADCKVFFPPGYNVPEESATDVKKKSKKRGKAKPVVAAEPQDGDVPPMEPGESTDAVGDSEEQEATVAEDAECQIPDDKEGEEEEEEQEDEEEEEGVGEVDKATSPMDGAKFVETPH